MAYRKGYRFRAGDTKGDEVGSDLRLGIVIGRPDEPTSTDD